eukprot:TRINITY_DN19415_c0_g1_i1.p1 TRINITY_DN19415_c0_g1~~TRINITY_DN19415_c0_g1_i1.p1  ORF type:complete len:157 (-),score=46.76 TRINITY_DN19415_c0_g1_i1:304-774(-)
MAGQSEKKQAQKYKGDMTMWMAAIGVINVLYIVLRVFYSWSTWTFWHMAGFVLFSAVSYVVYGMIDNASSIGVPHGELVNDLILVNLGTQVLVCFTDYGWLLYLTVPGYGLYKIGGLVHSYVFTPREGEGPESEEEKKKREKKEKKAEKVKYKTMR